MKKFKSVLCGMLCIALLAGCSSKEKSGKESLVIGLDNTFAPMGFKNEKGEIVGFDIDLAKAVGKIIKRSFTFQNIDWDLKESELESGNIDLIWNGYTITPERANKILFSDGYMENRQLIICLAENNIKNKNDLKAKTVSVQKNSSAYEAVMNDPAFVKQLDNESLIVFDTNNDCFMDLESMRSDAIVVDETLARYYMRQQANPDIYVILDDNFGDEKYGVGMRSEDKALCESINKAIEKLKIDGTFEQIRSKWFK